MNKEIKLAFDDSLALMLSDGMKSSGKIKGYKKSLKLTALENNGNRGEVGFDYLGGQKAYYFVMFGWSLEFSEYLKTIAPPYKSNVPEGFDHHFGMSTIMENRGVYSRSDGTISLPIRLDQIDEIIAHIQVTLNDFYLPWLDRFINFSPDLIDDIVKRPGYYSYPVPLISFILKKNKMKFQDLTIQIGKTVMKNKIFDTELLTG